VGHPRGYPAWDRWKGTGGRIKMSFAGDGIWDMGDREVEAKDYGLQARWGELGSR